jgi:hypothetical protein
MRDFKARRALFGRHFMLSMCIFDTEGQSQVVTESRDLALSSVLMLLLSVTLDTFLTSLFLHLQVRTIIALSSQGCCED